MKIDKELRSDHRLILKLVGPGSKVLDLGCGAGKLMETLSKKKGVDCTGIDRDPTMVAECISRQLKVFNLDFNKCLQSFKDDSFDHVLIHNSLQESRYPEKVIKEALRVGKNVVIGFPNFGYIRGRAQLFFTGKTPVTRALSEEWYNTRNLRFLTISDFRGYTEKNNIHILNSSFSPDNLITLINPNLFAEHAIFMIRANS